MQFKFIDTKNKEMYFTSNILETETKRVENNIDFFMLMDCFAVQNKAFHNCFAH